MIEWYLAFCAVVLIVQLYDNWDNGKDLVIRVLLLFTVNSLIPIWNVVIMIICGCDIYNWWTWRHAGEEWILIKGRRPRPRNIF